MSRARLGFPGSAEPIVRFEAVSKHFAGQTAVDDVSLELYAGEVFTLLGPSGCGKTTLMRLLAGFETPDAGRILLDGQDLAGRPPHERPVNMMFQSYALFPHLSVAQNVAYGLHRAGAAKAEVAARVERMLALVKLEGLGGRKPAQLSGGQQQRVALARALARGPRLLLLDEPLGALDRKLREETQFELLAIQRELGATFMVVTHDRDEAMTLSDRIGAMSAGRILQVGRPIDLYEAPQSVTVAGLLGEVNLFEGAEAGVVLAVRPEKMRLWRDPPPAEAGRSFEGQVRDAAYIGDWTSYVVELAGPRRVRVAQANAERRIVTELAPGERVWVSFTPEAAMAMPA